MTLEQLDDYRDVLARLVEERAMAKAKALAKCVTPLYLRCTCCGAQHVTNARCRRRWCPLCAPQISAKRFARVDWLQTKMAYPTYLVTTRRNVSDDEARDCIKVTKALNKRFRETSWWNRVQLGGVWAIEVTNIGNGWHPHTNYLIDANWLSLHTTPPQRGDSDEVKRQKCAAAHAELLAQWERVVGDHAGVHVKRAYGQAASEVLKYSVKSADLVRFPSRIEPIIDAIDDGRLMQRFGKSYGCKWPAVEKHELECEDCGNVGHITHDFRLMMRITSDKDRRAGMMIDEACRQSFEIAKVLDDASRFQLKAERTSEKIAARRAEVASKRGAR